MLSKNSLVFIVEDDKAYGQLIKRYLQKQGFTKVKLFDDEMQCLSCMTEYPDFVITDYHLNSMSGLKFILKAREITQGFYSILLSGAYHKERYSDDISLRFIDKYIQKGDNDMQQLSEILENYLNPSYQEQFY